MLETYLQDWSVLPLVIARLKSGLAGCGLLPHCRQLACIYDFALSHQYLLARGGIAAQEAGG